MTMSMQGDSAESSNGHGETATFDSTRPGVRVVVDPDPSAAAARLALELGGDVIRDIETARTAFAARADTRQVEPAVPDDTAVAELRELAAVLATTERIRTRTELEFTEALNRRLSPSSGMAVHPESIRQGAAAVVEAEAEVEGVDAAIGDLGERPKPEQVRLDAPDTVAETFDDGTLKRQRRTRAFAFGIATIFAGIAVAMLLLGVALVVPIAVLADGLLIAGVLIARSYTSRPDRGAAEASALLLAATGNAERTTEAAARDRLAEDEWLARRSQLEATRERSLEKVRSARRQWETLAGPDADPRDLETLLRRHDPQFVVTDAATRASPTVRTVNAVQGKALARWQTAWATLGHEPPPELDSWEAHLVRMRGGRGAEPMILVEPGDWISDDELDRLLSTLAAGAEVVVVRR